MDSIFIPVDFSTSSKAALRLGIAMATTMKKRIIVAHIYALPVAALTGINSENELELLMKKTEQQMMKDILLMVKKAYRAAGYIAIPAHTRCLVSYSDKAAQKIVEEAADNKAGMIIIGSKGVTGLRKLLFGSTAQAVVQRSPIPVLAVPAGCRRKSIKNLTVASDLLEIKDELAVLRPVAKKMQSRIHILHLQYGRINEALINDTKLLLSQRPFRDIGFSSVPAHLDKKLNDQLRADLKKTGADTLVMFPHKKAFWDRLLLGSKTEDMVGILKIPLLVLKLN